MIKGNSYRLPMTQEEIGNYVGLTTVHVNRVLKRLREADIVMMKSRTVTIRDVGALERLAYPVQDVFERTTPDFGGPEAA